MAQPGPNPHGPHPQDTYYFAPQYAPPPPPPPRNGLGIAALVLGIVALPLLITGLTAWISVILGLIAVPLALAGLGRVRRGHATNKGATIAGLVLGVVGVVMGILAVVVTVQAVDDALNGPTATISSGGPAGSSSTAGGDTSTSTEVAGPVALGTAVDIDGLVIAVTEVSSRKDITGAMTCAEVTYENRSDERRPRNMFDWTARDENGASEGPGLNGSSDALDSGDIAPGGTASGSVCFDLPQTKVAAIEYQGNVFTSGPDAEWLVRR
ncbi:DUF4352 domain-containing protein [Pseudonocardia zijingensis]|uniref:DUF4352 domain-containing protein n=1 Tax=Pseudonocardia zijingensis TaxID=153376 RepID=A0ABN1QJI3_9PSEU